MKKISLLIAVVLLAVILIMSGCGQKEKNSLEGKTQKNSTVKKIKPTGRLELDKAEIPKTSRTTASVSLGLYFSNSAGDKLVKEQHPVAATKEVAKAAIEQLVNGPTESGHYSVIPNGSRLLGISIQDNVATVDFSREFVDNHPGGSSAEILTIFSIVNTLTEYPSVTSVRFQVEGKNISSIAGHYDLSEPVKRDESLIVGQ